MLFPWFHARPHGDKQYAMLLITTSYHGVVIRLDAVMFPFHLAFSSHVIAWYTQFHFCGIPLPAG